MIKLDDIRIAPSPVHDKGVWVLHIEMGGMKFSGYFDSFPGFLTAVQDCGKYYAVRLGKMRAKDAEATRDIAPGRLN